jgi:hypothetical protein
MTASALTAKLHAGQVDKAGKSTRHLDDQQVPYRITKAISSCLHGLISLIRLHIVFAHIAFVLLDCT